MDVVFLDIPLIILGIFLRRCIRKIKISSNLIFLLGRNLGFDRKKIKIVNDYMKKRGINKFLQIKIKKYLEYMFEERKMNFKDTIFLTNSLSQSLKEEYYLELYGKILKTNRFFSLFSESFLNKLTHKFYETTYGPDDLIDVFIFFDTVNFCDFHFSYIYIY